MAAGSLVSSSCDPRHGVAMDDVDFKPQIAQMAQIAQSITSAQVVLAVSVSPFSGWRRVIETSNFWGSFSDPIPPIPQDVELLEPQGHRHAEVWPSNIFQLHSTARLLQPCKLTPHQAVWRQIRHP